MSEWRLGREDKFEKYLWRILAEINDQLDIRKRRFRDKTGVGVSKCKCIGIRTALVKYKRQKNLKIREDIKVSFRYLSIIGTS